MKLAIPEAHLTAMAEIGAQTTSKETYATIKLALSSVKARYTNQSYDIFLQGSYGNDTNIFKESDVDVVVCLNSTFTHELFNLPIEQNKAFANDHGSASYTHAHFREDVLATLRARFGSAVNPGTKAIMIESLHNRRKSDVLIAMQHRKYTHYFSAQNQSFVEGISFYKSDQTRVVNYPRQHRENMTRKNQATNEWLKHIVRIFKNSRQKLIEQNLIATGVAPSYYIEGLLYNVPKEKFGVNYETSMINSVNWLLGADRTRFVCANEQYMLLDGNSDVTWNSSDCDDFLNGLVGLWKNW